MIGIPCLPGRLLPALNSASTTTWESRWNTAISLPIRLRITRNLPAAHLQGRLVSAEPKHTRSVRRLCSVSNQLPGWCGTFGGEDGLNEAIRRVKLRFNRRLQVQGG